MAFLTLDHLIDENGEVDRFIYGCLVRRRAMVEYGSLAPRAIREAVQHYGRVIPVLIAQRLTQRGR